MNFSSRPNIANIIKFVNPDPPADYVSADIAWQQCYFIHGISVAAAVAVTVTSTLVLPDLTYFMNKSYMKNSLYMLHSHKFQLAI